MASPAIASAALKARVARPSMLKKLAHPEDLIPLFPNGAYIGWSGFTGVGYPKYVPKFHLQLELNPEPSIDYREKRGLFILLIILLQKDSNDARRPCRKEQLAGQIKIFSFRWGELRCRNGKPLGGIRHDRETKSASSGEIYSERDQ